MAHYMLGYRNLQRFRQDHQDNVLKKKQERLYQLVKEHDQEKIFAEIKHGANIKLPDENGEYVLHKAVEVRCIEPEACKEIIKMLGLFVNQYGLEVDLRCKSKKTALHIAVKNGMTEIADFLMKLGANFNAKDIRGNRMPHYMVEGEFERYFELTKETCVPPKEMRPLHRQSMQLVKWVLSKNTDFECANKNLDTPLHLAANRNLLHLLPILIENTYDVTARNKERKTALHVFVENKMMQTIKSSCYDEPDEIDILKMMLTKGYSVNAIDANGNTPVHCAALNDNAKLIEIMLEKYKKVNLCNGDGNTALHLIIDNCIDYTLHRYREKFANLVRIILARGADINIRNKDGYSPLNLAVMRMEPTILQLLKDREAYLAEPYNGGNLLHLLSQDSTAIINVSKVQEVISLLVSQGCDVNAKNKDGMTAMHLAVKSERNAVIEGLINCHANVDARELSGRKLTPLHMAVEGNHYLSMNILIKYGAHVNAKDSSGMTALHLAMEYDTDIVNTLLKSGAHVDVEDDEELLPQHYAIRKENGVALIELLKFGADINDIDTYRELVSLQAPGYALFIVLMHWIKMKAAGLPVAPAYRSLAHDDNYKKHYRNCLNEVEDMKAYKICQRVSLYDLLHMDWNFRCAYTGNKPFKDLVKSPSLETTFPKYHVLILACYHDAVARQTLLEPAKHAWHELTKVDLPNVCVYRILASLSNRDLRKMVDGVRDKSFRKPYNLLFNDYGHDFK